MDIVHALMELYAFKTLYIADLDAIQKRGNHHKTVAEIRRHFPGLTLWLDAGIHHPEHCQTWEDSNPEFVIGSENLESVTQFEMISRFLTPRQPILSLDYAHHGFLGPRNLLDNSNTWPARIIAMTLAKVGSMEGPNIALLKALQSTAVSKQLYAAGGVRDMDDLLTLSSAGVTGALVASALHDSRITSSYLEAI